MQQPLSERAGSHLVQFYEAEEFLYQTVRAFFAEGAVRAEPAVVIATEAHWAGFGLDPDEVIFLDARETLAQFMRDGMPDEERFMTVIGGVLERLSSSAPPRARIRAYGEMVDLLWRDGNADAAIRLEELWNEIGKMYPLTLLCAYPMNDFGSESDTRRFARVCDEHGLVFPAESYDRHTDDDARLREVAALQQRAAALEAEIERRRELERELREKADDNARLYQLAEQHNRTKDEFLATVSHELRTPLTAILGWARMLSLGGLDEKTTHTAVETIERSARAQAALVDDLLDLSRVVTGNLTLHSEPVDLGAAVGNAVETLRLAAEARGIRIEISSPERCVVTGDAMRLQQVAWNLLSNAVKFSEPDGTVTIAIDCIGDEAQLTVRDHGRGIAPSFIPYAFEPFRQADGASTRAHNGLGLGLAIVKYLVELHGGTVRAESAGDGCGATFTVSLPLA